MKIDSPKNENKKKSQSPKNRRNVVLEEVETETLDKKIKDANKVIFGGRFEVDMENIIGNGAFGEIYLALDTTTNEQCALKRVKNNKINNIRKICKQSAYSN